MLLGLYESKDALRRSVGQPLHYQETQIIVSEYRANGVVTVHGAAPGPDGTWVAEVYLRHGHIVHVD